RNSIILEEEKERILVETNNINNNKGINGKQYEVNVINYDTRYKELLDAHNKGIEFGIKKGLIKLHPSVYKEIHNKKQSIPILPQDTYDKVIEVKDTKAKSNSCNDKSFKDFKDFYCKKKFFKAWLPIKNKKFKCYVVRTPKKIY